MRAACSRVTHTNPDLVKETHALFCIACYGFCVEAEALLVNVVNGRLLALGGNGSGMACGHSSCLVMLYLLSIHRCA